LICACGSMAFGLVDAGAGCAPWLSPSFSSSGLDRFRFLMGGAGGWTGVTVGVGLFTLLLGPAFWFGTGG
jgi:hypothetical protein